MDAKERRRLLRKRAVRRQLGLMVAALFVMGLSIYFVSSITSAKMCIRDRAMGIRQNRASKRSITYCGTNSGSNFL